MTVKMKIALIYGGKSAEHEVSLRSARSVYKALDKSKYEVVLIGIDKAGSWHLQSEQQLLNEGAAGKKACVSSQGEQVVFVGASAGKLISVSNGKLIAQVDLAFPVIHGPMGEDGTLQGLLQLVGIPYVGCGFLASSVCMDKEVAKRLMCDAQIPNARFLSFTSTKIDFESVKKELGLPVFIKPANLGSSVGVSRATDEKSFHDAVALAFRFDRKILVEEEIKGREIECSVMGNEDPEASVLGEIIPASKHGFYSYEAKYLDDDGAGLAIPAKLPEALAQKVRQMALKVYKALCCEGMARVDFFVSEGNSSGAQERVCVNELNTIPGFTSISMYPKLWEASGLSYSDLLDKLIALAAARFEIENRLQTCAF